MRVPAPIPFKSLEHIWIWLVEISNVPPLIYIAMDCIMRYVFSMRVFKQMDAPKRARIH